MHTPLGNSKEGGVFVHEAARASAGQLQLRGRRVSQRRERGSRLEVLGLLPGHRRHLLRPRLREGGGRERTPSRKLSQDSAGQINNAASAVPYTFRRAPLDWSRGIRSFALLPRLRRALLVCSKTRRRLG